MISLRLAVVAVLGATACAQNYGGGYGYGYGETDTM